MKKFAVVDTSTVVLAIVDDLEKAMFIRSCILDSVIEEVHITKDIPSGFYKFSNKTLEPVGVHVYPDIVERIQRASLIFKGLSKIDSFLNRIQINNSVLSDRELTLFYLNPDGFIFSFSSANNYTYAEAKKHINFCVVFQTNLMLKIQEFRWVCENRLKNVKTKAELKEFSEFVEFSFDLKGHM